MKFAFLAASALALSVPAFAQDTTTPPPAEPDTMQTQDSATQTPPATDPAAAPPATDPTTARATAPADPAAAAPTAPVTSAPTSGTMTDGGYAPAAPPMAGAAQPGAQVVFKPSVPVAQAFPPPPPKEEYPVCRGAVKDGCKNPGGK
jgi:hypothetical protein